MKFFSSFFSFKKSHKWVGLLYRSLFYLFGNRCSKVRLYTLFDVIIFLFLLNCVLWSMPHVCCVLVTISRPSANTQDQQVLLVVEIFKIKNSARSFAVRVLEQPWPEKTLLSDLILVLIHLLYNSLTWIFNSIQLNTKIRTPHYINQHVVPFGHMLVVAVIMAEQRPEFFPLVSLLNKHCVWACFLMLPQQIHMNISFFPVCF